MLNDIGKLFAKKQKTDSTMYGTVKTVNGDGTYTIETGYGEITCDKMVGAKVGDTVMILVQKTGHATVIGTVGGDTDAADAQETADNALEAYKIVPLTGGNISVNAGDTGTMTVSDTLGEIPTGYKMIGILSITNVIGHNSRVAITDWRVNSIQNEVTINFVNTGSAVEYVTYAVAVLVTNL